MRANDIISAFPTHLGEILKDEIEYRGISQRQFEDEMGIAYSALNIECSPSCNRKDGFAL